MSERGGRVVGVNGNLVTVGISPPRSRRTRWRYVIQGDLRLIAEVIRVRGRYADMQVFESTAGIEVGDPVEFAGGVLSVELGPGLLTQVYDGLQNPLNLIAAHHGFFLSAASRSRRCRATRPGSRRAPRPATGCAPETRSGSSRRASSNTASWSRSACKGAGDRG